MNTLTFSLVLAVISLIVFVGAIAWHQARRQRPLTEFTRGDFQLAFRFAPEERAKVVNRGSMSRLEFVQLQKLNLRRITAELARRGVTS